jgi:uncharacterized Zn finger protein (UPF0148 family)
MKTCEQCGEEIGTKDGDNLCEACDQDRISKARKARAKANRRAREAAMESIGMTKVRGAMGGTYWE